MGWGVPVRWIWTGSERMEFSDRYNVRRNSLYEEQDAGVQVLELLLSQMMLPIEPAAAA